MARGRKKRIELPTRKTKQVLIDKLQQELKQTRLENRELRQKQEIYKAQLRKLFTTSPLTKPTSSYGPPVTRSNTVDVFARQSKLRFASRPRWAQIPLGTTIRKKYYFPCATSQCKGRTTKKGTPCPACVEKEEEEEGDEADEESSEPDEDDPSDCEPPASAPPSALIAVC
jgi:hypothetical protein